MKSNLRLHHYAQNIVEGSLNDVLEMYKLLSCEVVYRPKDDITWVMVGQKETNFSIQVIEVDDAPIIDIDTKKSKHVAFISGNPQRFIDTIKDWANTKDIAFRDGGWSEIERYFDLPDIFVNFVIEIMHTSIEEG